MIVGYITCCQSDSLDESLTGSNCANGLGLSSNAYHFIDTSSSVSFIAFSS
ncbi:hypothetical protein [Staphylococcus shinii]|uniref:hypothetical protein n=1 Tax=Staphylococcus shinii TaxID=2912228 RepID=UPI003F545E2C